MKVLLPSEKLLITHTITDGEEDLGIRCKIFDKELNDVTPDGYIELTHKFAGMYGYVHDSGFPVGMYVVVFEIFDDNTYVDISEKYGIIEENIRISNTVVEVLAGIPDNILLDDDARLDNLTTIPSLAKETTVINTNNSVITQIQNTVNDSDGGAV